MGERTRVIDAFASKLVWLFGAMSEVAATSTLAAIRVSGLSESLYENPSARGHSHQAFGHRFLTNNLVAFADGPKRPRTALTTPLIPSTQPLSPNPSRNALVTFGGQDGAFEVNDARTWGLLRPRGLTACKSRSHQTTNAGGESTSTRQEGFSSPSSATEQFLAVSRNWEATASCVKQKSASQRERTSTDAFRTSPRRPSQSFAAWQSGGSRYSPSRRHRLAAFPHAGQRLTRSTTTPAAARRWARRVLSTARRPMRSRARRLGGTILKHAGNRA